MFRFFRGLALAILFVSSHAFAAATSHGAMYDMGEFLEARKLRVGRHSDGSPILLMGTFRERLAFQFEESDEESAEERVDSLKNFAAAVQKAYLEDDEAYLMMDEWDNGFFLTLAGNDYIRARIALHQFLELLEIPHSPVYPTFVKRGQNGIPTAEQIRALHPLHQRAGTLGEAGDWIPAIIEPSFTYVEQVPPQPDTVALQAAKTTQMVLTVFLVRPGRVSTRGNAEYFQGFMAEMTEPFYNITQNLRDRHPLRDFLWNKSKNSKLLPQAAMKDFTEEQVKEYCREVNHFLNRLEHMIRTGEVDDIFRYMGLVDGVAFLPLLKKTGLSLRKEFADFLRDSVGGRFRTTYLENAAGIELKTSEKLFSRYSIAPEPAVVTATHDLAGGSIPSLAEALREPKLTLYSLSQLNPYWFEKWLSNWKSESPTEKDPVGTLLDQAAKRDTRILLLTSQKDPRDIREGIHQVWQSWINTHAPRTLLILSANDRESRTVKNAVLRVAERADIILYPDSKKEQGKGYSYQDFLDFLEFARRENCKRIIVFENGEIPDGTREMFQQAGIDFRRIDHHGTKREDNSNKLSSGEQLLMRMYRYIPAPNELYSWILDRSQAIGLYRAGLKPSEIARLISHRSVAGEKAMDKYREVQSWNHHPNTVYQFTDFQGAMESWALPIGVASLPHVPTLIFQGKHRIRVSAPIASIEALKSHFLPKDPEGNFVYFGGDVGNIGYFSIRMHPGTGIDYQAALADIETILRGKMPASNENSMPCWKQIPVPANGFGLMPGAGVSGTSIPSGSKK